MITNRSTYGYIGGSDANRLFGSFETETFRAWWQERLTGISLTSFSTIDTAVGNIMEAKVLDEVGVLPEHRNIFVKKEGSMAGINTDALCPDFYHEVKTSVPEGVYDWLRGMAVSAAYRRQVMHGLYVTGRKAAKIHVLPLTRAEKKNVFGIDIKGRVKTFVLGNDGLITGEGFNVEFKNPKPFDFGDYDRRVRYLDMCFAKKERPSDSGFNQFT